MFNRINVLQNLTEDRRPILRRTLLTIDFSILPREFELKVDLVATQLIESIVLFNGVIKWGLLYGYFNVGKMLIILSKVYFFVKLYKLFFYTTSVGNANPFHGTSENSLLLLK